MDVDTIGETSTTNDMEIMNVSCPICEKFLSSKEIIDHVDRCIFLRQDEELLNKSSDTVKDPSRDGNKRSFPLFEKNLNPAPKKMKLSPGRMGSNKKGKTIDLTLSQAETRAETDLTEKVDKIEEETKSDIPLAEKVRPKTIEEFIG